VPRSFSCRPLVIDHYDSYTASLVDLVAQVTGTEPAVVQHDQVRVDDLLGAGHTHIVLSPGPGHPDRPEDFAIGRDLLARTTVPVLGVCLGHQGIVSAFGGRVAHVTPAHGTVSAVDHDGSTLFRGVPSTFRAVRYHSLAAVDVPDCLRVTAWCDGTDGQRAVMAVEHKSRPVFGVQFHPESVLTEHGLQLVRNFLGDAASASAVTPAGSARTTVVPARVVAENPAAQQFSWVEPEDFFATHVSSRRRVFWLDGRGRRDPEQRFSYLGWLRDDEQSLVFKAAAATVREHRDLESRVVGTDIFQVLQEEIGADRPTSAQLPFQFTGGWVGYLGYGCRTDLPARTDAADKAPPDACLMRVTRFLAFDHEAGVVYAVSRDPDPSGWFGEVERLLATAGAAAPDCTVVASTGDVEDVALGDYVAAFGDVRDALLDGDSYEANLTYRVRIRSDVDPVLAFSRIRALGSTPYAALLRHHEVSVVSASPECFLRVDADRRIESRPIKGTASRGTDAEDDARQRDSLVGEPRFIAENLMVTDLVRHDLATVCERGSVQVPALMQVESYSNVHQLVTTVRGRLCPEVTTMGAVAALFPPASMTGAPKRRTMELIARVEGSPRGVYSGALGWIGVDGQADLGVVIRTMTVVGDLLEIGTGGAVTVHSEAAEEYAETRWKIGHLTAAVLGASATVGGRRGVGLVRAEALAAGG
jgi:para-aminobenzoate synthetase